MNDSGEAQQRDVLALVRSLVRERLAATPSFSHLPEETRDQVARDMVKVAGYIVGGESGDSVPAAVVFTDAEQGGGFTELVRDVDFPQFVADLIDGVFHAIVRSSIEQMEAYGELVKNAARSVDELVEGHISENQARDYLADHHPGLLEAVRGRRSPLKPKGGHHEQRLHASLHELGLRAARRRIAMDRQQLLATTLLMGINRIIVTEGKIKAKVVFRLNSH